MTKIEKFVVGVIVFYTISKFAVIGLILYASIKFILTK